MADHANTPIAAIAVSLHATSTSHATPTAREDTAQRDLPIERLVHATHAFHAAFGSSATDPSQPTVQLALAPGRINLIGEHIDYEGYSVLPMAITQDMAVAIRPACSDVANTNSSSGICLRIRNTNRKYHGTATSLTREAMDAALNNNNSNNAALFNALINGFDAHTVWARFVVCGYMAVMEWSPQLSRRPLAVDVLVDGGIPPACGLSSSSALVVASAIAFAAVLCGGDGDQRPTRSELAEKCRDAEQYVGTVGGGMDQAVSCLAIANAALHVAFAPRFHVTPVAFPAQFQQRDVVFLVVNSGVEAHKAVDASTRFNKRVVECALAAKLLGKRLGLQQWETMTRLVDVQTAMEQDRGQAIPTDELLHIAAKNLSDCDEYKDQQELQNELMGTSNESLSTLFKGSRLDKAATRVLVTSSKLKLWQRVRHVWSEANRVHQYQQLLLQAHDSHEQKVLQQLGDLMVASHASCKDLYECSCPELDSIVEICLRAGAYGARLTGAGWGGCVMALVAKENVATVRGLLEREFFATAISPAASRIFESQALGGARLFSVSSFQ